jgi:hypothetical protein
MRQSGDSPVLQNTLTIDMANPSIPSATQDTNIESQPSSFQTLEAAGKVLAMVVGFLYISGLLMVNLYLLRFGASDFSILRTRYALSGMIVLITFLVFAASGIYAAYSETLGRESQVIRSLLVGLPVAAYAVLTFVVPLPGSTQSSRAIYLRAALISTLIYAASSWVAHLRSKRLSDPDYRPVFGIAGLLIFGFLIVLPVATYEVYPRIPAQFGGGRSVRARVAIADDDQDQLISLGVALSPDTKISFPLDIIHDGESFLVLRTNHSVVQVERKSIVGIWVEVPGIEFRGEDHYLPPSQIPENMTMKEIAVELNREHSVNRGLNRWEFMDLSHSVFCVIDAEKDNEKQLALGKEMIDKIFPLLPTFGSECRAECEELTKRIYEDCERVRGKAAPSPPR